MTGRDLFTGKRPVPAEMLAELAALRAALPGYAVIITQHSPHFRFEAIRHGDDPGTWCVISTDPADLWRELAPPPDAAIHAGAGEQPSPTPSLQPQGAVRQRRRPRQTH